LNILDAADFAAMRGWPLNVDVSINWNHFSGQVADVARIGRALHRLAAWCRRRRFPLVAVWVRELGGAPNLHMAMHMPSDITLEEFQAAFERALAPEGASITDQAILLRPIFRLRGWIEYLLKGLRPRDAEYLNRKFGLKISCVDQGTIVGKRVAVTENISRAARARHLPGGAAYRSTHRLEVVSG
jgi:hypothetical protein